MSASVQQNGTSALVEDIVPPFEGISTCICCRGPLQQQRVKYHTMMTTQGHHQSLVRGVGL
jgi:hypothetical protein